MNDFGREKQASFVRPVFRAKSQGETDGAKKVRRRIVRDKLTNEIKEEKKPFTRTSSVGNNTRYSNNRERDYSSSRNENGGSYYGSNRTSSSSGNRYSKPYDRNSRFGNKQQGNKRPFDKKIEKPSFQGKKYVDVTTSLVDLNVPIRLNKYLANAGICSRREADNYIQAGVVSVNGVTVTELGTKVNRTDKVLFHGEGVQTEKKVYILLNKPKNCVTTSDDPQERMTVLDIVKNACKERIYPVGRLDKNTTGVLLLTNDGDLASRLTHPKHEKKKIYHVYLDKPVEQADIDKISQGIELEDGIIKSDDISYPDVDDKKQVGIEIHSGKNRIVRRIFEHLGYRVIKLDRVYFAGLTKKNIPRGKWRFLTAKEITSLIMGAYE